MTPDLLEVGRIDKAHGLAGELVVTLVTDRAERLAPGAVLLAGSRELTVRSSKPYQHRWLVVFEGVHGREAAEALRGTPLLAEPIEGRGDELWVHELVGAEVRMPDGTVQGVVEAVQSNPASDLLVLDSGALVPIVFVTDSAGLPGHVVIDPPDGLFDL